MDGVKLNIHGRPYHPERGLKKGPTESNRKPPNRGGRPGGKPLGEWERNELRTRAKRLYRGHEIIIKTINAQEGQYISRGTYFNALRGEPITERTREILFSYLKYSDAPGWEDRTWEERLMNSGMSEDKAKYWGQMLRLAINADKD